MGHLMLAISISLALIWADGRYAIVEYARSTLHAVLSPVQLFVNTPFELADWLDEGTTSRSELLQENALLRDKVMILESQLQRSVALETENIQLRNLLGAVKRSDEKRLVAEVLSVDSDPFSHLVTLNRGRLNGVFKGQPVLDSRGVIGQVVHTSELVCQVLLLTDRVHSIPVRVSRNGVRAIAVGTGKLDEMVLQHVPDTADIIVGDILITSGLGQRFPDGYPVAEVVSIHRDPGKAFADIVLRPIAQLERIKQVLLLWPNIPSELRADEVNNATANDQEGEL
jgi:rod shape-determining protein MreC